MSFVTDTWRQLVRRRLWPVALLLLAALAAVPYLLAKDPEPAAVPAAPAANTGKATLAEDTGDPVVTLANADEARRRRVLGAAKDPFEPAPAKKVKKVKSTGAGSATPEATATATPEASGGSAGGGAASPDTRTPVVPVPTATPAPKKKTYPLYTLTVRFGDSSSDTLERRKVTRLEALPDVDTPALVYLGVKDGGKAAVFMLDSSVTAQGDGSCEPSPANCETVVLREGETEFFDVAGEGGLAGRQFQLDLIDINTKKSSSRKLSSASEAGAAAVKAHAKVGGSLRYRYNARKGTLRRLGLKASKTASANAEAALVGSF